MKKLKNILASEENKIFAIRRYVIFLLSLIGLIFFLLSYTTGYYTFGEMNSLLILTLIIASLLSVAVSVIATKKATGEGILTMLTFFITALLIASAALLLGDRMEGIGFTVLTQFDAGRGGEEACYLSFVSMGSFLIAGIVNIVGSFSPSFRKREARTQ